MDDDYSLLLTFPPLLSIHAVLVSNTDCTEISTRFTQPALRLKPIPWITRHQNSLVTIT